jgi:hypothetical protein
MAVPEQVRKQTEAVQALYDDLNNPAENPSPENGEGISAEVVDITPAQGTPADSVSNEASTSAPAEQGGGGQNEDPNSETYEQRWRTAQGMINAELPRLNAQIQGLSQRNQQLEQLISNMQNVPAPTPEPVTPVSSLTAEETEEYGESIDIMRKVSQEVAGHYQQEIDGLKNTIAQLQGTVVPRVEQIASKQAQTAEQSFWSSLTTAVPNWREINDNQDFQSWLLEVDPLSGLARQTYLEDAQRNMDYPRVASFFSSWQSATGAAVAQPNRTASELEKQVTPGKGRSSGTSQGGTPKTYTPQDITKFFEKVRTGKFAGKEKERDIIERDIFAAQAEGRIVQA